MKPTEKEIEEKIQEIAHSITCGGHDRLYAANGQGKILDDITYEEVCDELRNLVEWINSK